MDYSANRYFSVRVWNATSNSDPLLAREGAAMNCVKRYPESILPKPKQLVDLVEILPSFSGGV